MKISWSSDAEFEVLQTIDYWNEHNGSSNYSAKIYEEIQKALKQIKENPIRKNHYSEKMDLYVKVFFKGKFAFYYKIIEEEDAIWIIYFRSMKQKPIF